jgi:lipopolysaccharide/colanic/teichoic acid biosynthesis glycosyltransferase
VRRAFDIVVAGAALAFFSPVLLVAMRAPSPSYVASSRTPMIACVA